MQHVQFTIPNMLIAGNLRLSERIMETQCYSLHSRNSLILQRGLAVRPGAGDRGRGDWHIC